MSESGGDGPGQRATQSGARARPGSTTPPWSTTRRRALAGGAAALATALAGCSALPFGSEDEPKLGFDPERVPESVVTDVPDRPSAYPGPVPERLADHHRQRAQALLDAVPSDPSFPNGKLSERLASERESVAESLEDGPEGEPTALDRLGNWRYTRSTAAEVRGAYRAAEGDVDAAALESRREEVRQDLLQFEADWSYPGVDGVTAIAVNHRFEVLRSTCQRYLSPRSAFPAEPTAAVFRVGSLVADLERARAELDDLTGLRDAYRDSVSPTESGYRSELSILAGQLEQVLRVSREQVDPYLDDADTSIFDRDIERLPAGQLYVRLHGVADHRIDEVETARSRGDDAQAVVAAAQGLVAVVALATAVEAIRDGDYGMPESVSAVQQHRDAAIEALDRTRSLDPTVLATLLAQPAWYAVDDRRYIVTQMRKHEESPDERDVVHLVAAFAGATHLARAVPEVLDRVRREVEDVAG